MLSQARIVEVGETPYAHEREAIQFAQQELPNTDPLQLWALVELLEPSTGRLHEIDLLVLGYSALYLVEVKSGPGRYEGDQVDWLRTPPEGTARWMDPPRNLANHKAKVLKSLLCAKMKEPQRAPRVEALVFLSHPEIELRLAPEGRIGVVTRQTFVRAITHHQFPGAPTDWRATPINTPLARDITQAIGAIGIRKRKGKMHVGAYELGAVLEDGSGYQDRVAVHRDTPGLRRRARIYLVPQQTSVERRQQLRRAADREAQLLYEVREHRSILHFADYVTDAPMGPAVLFDTFDDSIPLDAFLRKNPSLPFGERVAIVEQIGRALSFCHKKDITHGALGPHAVLVRRHPETQAIEARLFNFQLGAGRDVEATSHWSALAAEPWAIYQAPELREDRAARGPQSDIFSLGALAYLVFTGRPPGESVAEVDARLDRDRSLDPRAVDDGIPQSVVGCIQFATEKRLALRADDAGQWVELLLEETTSPPEAEPAAPEVDPLQARKHDKIGDDLTVQEVLGHGATSRVLRVERESDGRHYALKISLSADHDERLKYEAQVLSELRHPRIVQLVELRTIALRTCLLLSLAGDQTLQRFLSQHGTVSLDYASRYGEDLLAALEELEEKQIVHRDIKPANLGVGTPSKSANHLTLFDFSLVQAPRTEISVGTSAYRDPFLRQRGAWDAAADRWSVAVTLHEMLTGVRPSLDAADAGAAPRIAAERFEPSVRDRLVVFFERVLHQEAEQRFVSAKAMRHAWIGCFEAPPASVAKKEAPTSRPSPAWDPGDLTDEDIERVLPDTPVEALPLSPRARSALDRAGLVRAGDLLDLPDNRLSAVRGVGRHVAREILDFRNRWQGQHAAHRPESKPFFPGYRGADLLLSITDLAPAFALAFQDAGLHTLGAIALAPSAQVAALAERHGAPPSVLADLLERENRAANERAHPSTIEGWLDVLLPKQTKRSAHIRTLFGLDGPFAGRTGATVAEVAEHHHVTRPAVYIALAACRARWQKHAALGQLRAMVHEVTEQAGGCMPLDRAAAALRALLPHDRSAGDALAQARAAALVRIVCEVEREAPSALRLVRLHEDVPWVAASEAHGIAVAALGAAADELAARAVLVSPGEAARVFAEVARDTPLSALPTERLADLAAAASRGAARSTRLEIYPRGMPAERALELCAAVLTGAMTPEDIVQRVIARYPESAPLPERPALDALLERHSLRWDPAGGRYERPGERPQTTLETTFSSAPRPTLPPPSRARAPEPESLAAVDFDERLARALERRALRVLGVPTDRAREVALALGNHLGVRPQSFDSLLIAAIRRQMQAHEVDPDVVHEADHDGPGGAAWTNLLNLAELAAADVARTLLPPRAPLLLVQPGLLARYRLEGFLKALVDASKRDECAAIFLLVPSRDTGGIPRINGELSIKGILPSQALWVPPGWLRRSAARGEASISSTPPPPAAS